MKRRNRNCTFGLFGISAPVVIMSYRSYKHTNWIICFYRDYLLRIQLTKMHIADAGRKFIKTIIVHISANSFHPWIGIYFLIAWRNKSQRIKLNLRHFSSLSLPFTNAKYLGLCQSVLEQIWINGALKTIIHFHYRSS